LIVRNGCSTISRRWRIFSGWLLPIGGVKLLQIPRDALLDLRHPPLHLGAAEIPVAVIYPLELTAVDRDAAFRRQQAAFL